MFDNHVAFYIFFPILDIESCPMSFFSAACLMNVHSLKIGREFVGKSGFLLGKLMIFRYF